MKRLLLLLLMVPLLCQAQEPQIDLDQLMSEATQWAQENLDEDLLAALPELDEQKARELLGMLDRQLKESDVLDLAALKQGAQQVLPILASYEETAPYAAWLRTRLDYLVVADELRLKVPPVKPEPGVTSKPLPIPTPEIERQVWTNQLRNRPWPEKASRYVTPLKRVFASEKVPPELVWLAEVESSFESRAMSPAGAAGLFQLMPATAKQYGLRTWPTDQRYHPEESARAAAKHLRHLHGRFKDWRLALAAYNAGEGTLQKAIGKQKNATFDRIAQKLPAETQMYVPKVEAVLLRREGVRLEKL
jgi:membrane-bound lytic murein transglycosylase D